MKKLLIFALGLASLSSLADSFVALHAETPKYTIKADAEFQRLIGTDLKNCAVTLNLNAEKTAIEFKMGILGSNFEYFGWDMYLPLEDFPLRTGYSKEFKTPGMSTMLLQYDGTTLSFHFLKRDGLWNTIHPFELKIDSHLTTPHSLKASLEGYETDFLGRPKKHVIEQCNFDK